MPDYYMVRRSDLQAVAGPFESPYIVAALVDVQETPTEYGSASRYELAKQGKYPKNKAGEAQLAADVKESGKYPEGLVFCRHCGGSLRYMMYRGWAHDADWSTDGASFTKDMQICGKAEADKQ